MLLKMNVFVWICIFAVANGLPQRKVNKDSDVKIEKQLVVELPQHLANLNTFKTEQPQPVQSNTDTTNNPNSNTEEIMKKISQVNEEHALKPIILAPLNNDDTSNIVNLLQAQNSDTEIDSRENENGEEENIDNRDLLQNGRLFYRQLVFVPYYASTPFERYVVPTYMPDNVSPYLPNSPHAHYPENVDLYRPDLAQRIQYETPTILSQQSDSIYQNIENRNYIQFQNKIMQAFPSLNTYALNSFQRPPVLNMVAKSPQLNIYPNTNVPKYQGIMTRAPTIWPFSNLFPVLINDPFLAIQNGFSNFIEYGPEADICKGKKPNRVPNNRPKNSNSGARPYKTINSRTGKSIQTENFPQNGQILYVDENLKRINPTVLALGSPDLDKDDDDDEARRFFTRRQNKTEQVPVANHPPVQYGNQNDNDNYQDDVSGENDQDGKIPKLPVKPAKLLLGAAASLLPGYNKKPLMTSDNIGEGIFIDKIKVRKGGVAIAGPGGIATAGGGGTAIVGPHGFALTQRNGVAIAGPGARVISIPDNLDLTEFIVNVNKGKASEARYLSAGGKLVATGPVVYFDSRPN